MQSASATLHKLVGDLLRRAPVDEAAMNAWPMVCGAAVAAKTRAVAFRGGALYVEVPDKGWRAELVGLLPQYMAAINRMVSSPVEKIVFLLAGERMPEVQR